MKIILFGIGAYTDAILGAVRPEVEIVGCIDNDPKKQGLMYAGVTITPISDGLNHQFDYIVVGFTVGYEMAIQQLEEYGVDSTKIIIPYAFDHTKYNVWNTIFNITELNYIEVNMRLKNIEYALENIPFELYDAIRNKKIWIPTIRNWKETINEILSNKKSISRFGDGEFDLILGRKCSLQTNNSRLAEMLESVLSETREDLLIGIPDVFGSYETRGEAFKEIFRRNLAKGGRSRIYNLLDQNKVYYDSFVSRPYKPHMNLSEAKEHFSLIRKIWENRDITIIEGAQTRMGIGNDLFSDAKAMERIICPVINAFDKYDEILGVAKSISKDRLILMALGPTATVLARDLAACGYQAIDIGHIDVEYEWYLRGEITAIAGKFVNEAPMGRIVSDEGIPREYYDQIVARIGV